MDRSAGDVGGLSERSLTCVSSSSLEYFRFNFNLVSDRYSQEVKESSLNEALGGVIVN